MKRTLIVLTLLSLCVIGCEPEKERQGPPSVLVFSKTMGFKHSSIPNGIAAIGKLGQENGFVVDTTTNAELFNDGNLKQYAAVIFLSTTGNVLDHRQEAAFERYIQSGGGFVGVHAATDTEYDWGWYTKLVGGQFLSHPAGAPEADFIITDRDFPATSFFTDTIWHRADELYNFKNLNNEVNVVMTVDESTYQGGANGDFHPMAWYHEYDGGRAFYTAAGHTKESFTEELFLKHLLGGIQYAIGGNLELDYAKATTQIPPDNDRFTKVNLNYGGFFEPTEMTVLPNNDVLVAQRRGEIVRYDAKTKTLTEIAALDVYHKTLNTPGVNAEEGLMGLQKDPNYANNHWVYVYYAPAGDHWVNRLSRFKYSDGNFDLRSEQVILELETEREICCHTGGSIAFGPEGLLYLSTGDNSTPFDEKGAKYVNSGFGPLNDSPGHKQFDARRTSANTNDLRGKILRIKVHEDGTYTIPKGNLFPEGTAKTRPEIYTMGHRNPYRISVDPKNGYLYWGEVGPDASNDSLKRRGPKGYDEMGQAREAGNFGWPMFIGNNIPYVDYDYETGESGRTFNPRKPINDSKNNTGLRELPPAQPAYVYYPYGESQDFPQVGSGGRNAMAGPVYYSDLYPDGGGLPTYYNGKVIIYEWMRGWMMAVSLFEDGTFNKMEPFAPNIQLNNLIDMEMGPDGKVYLLEYGTGWFTQNENSGLGYIQYNAGNRPPVVEAIAVNKTSGQLPLEVTASVKAHDREADAMTYVWDFGNGDTKETKEGQVQYTYDAAGNYKLSVEVVDSEGEAAQGEPATIVAGNSRPVVQIDVKGGNSSFFIKGQPIEYTVSVTDPDTETIDPSRVFVSVDYLESTDAVGMSLGHQQVSAEVMGKALTQSMDCKACHKENDKSIGPSYSEIAKKYKDDSDAATYLQKKIVRGGSGVWGEVMMPAHSEVGQEELRQLSTYILSLGGNQKKEKSLPLAGQLLPDPAPRTQLMVLRASYTDEGQEGAAPLTGTATRSFKSNTLNFPGKVKAKGFTAMQFNGMNLLIVPDGGGWFTLNDIDLTGVQGVQLAAGWQQAPAVGLNFEVRRDAPDGELLGSGYMNAPAKGQPGGAIVVPFKAAIDAKVSELYFLYAPRDGEALGSSAVGLVNVTFTGS